MNRQQIKADLSAKFKRASGRSSLEHGIDQWDVLVDALLDAVVEIVKAEAPRDPGTFLLGGKERSHD